MREGEAMNELLDGRSRFTLAFGEPVFGDQCIRIVIVSFKTRFPGNREGPAFRLRHLQ
jgi:hypothetical protein